MADTFHTRRAQRRQQQFGADAALRYESPVNSELENETADQLRKRAREVFRSAYPRLRRSVIDIHHRVPLEWRHLFPNADPNRLSNLQALPTRDHQRKATDLWTAFRLAYQRAGRQPSARDVLRFAALVDHSLQLPYPL